MDVARNPYSNVSVSALTVEVSWITRGSCVQVGRLPPTVGAKSDPVLGSKDKSRIFGIRRGVEGRERWFGEKQCLLVWTRSTPDLRKGFLSSRGWRCVLVCPLCMWLPRSFSFASIRDNGSFLRAARFQRKDESLTQRKTFGSYILIHQTNDHQMIVEVLAWVLRVKLPEMPTFFTYSVKKNKALLVVGKTEVKQFFWRNPPCPPSIGDASWNVNATMKFERLQYFQTFQQYFFFLYIEQVLLRTRKWFLPWNST